MKKRIDEPSRQMLGSFSKIGVLVTEDDAGYPHATFLNSIQALGENQLTFGQFSAGRSKEFIQKRPQVGFLALNKDMQFLRGNAVYTHSEITGPESDAYNDIPMFRYNTYFGFSRVFYMDLSGITRLDTLDMKQIVLGAIATRLAVPFRFKSRHHALPHTARQLFSKLDSLKFLAYFDDAGLARIIPIIQASHAGTDRIVFSGIPFRKELARIPDGAKAAVLCVTLDMEAVLVKGIYHGGRALIPGGRVEIEYVYNSMPPKMEYVYPRSEAVMPVTAF